MPTEIKTGVGRIVWGNPAKSQTKKQQQGPDKGKPVIKDGQPVNQWACGIAFPKAEFQQMIWPGMAAEAAAGYPNGVPPRFAWKYQDGDGIDSNGQPFNKREGYAGCYVLTVSSEAFAPPIYKYQNGGYVQLNGDQIKTGDYVAVAIKFQVNVPPQGSTNTPSLYVNPVAIEHVGYGAEIQNGPDPMALFGGQQRQLPAGASATPLAPSHGVGMPGTGGPGNNMPNGNPGNNMPNGNPGNNMPNGNPGNNMPNGNPGNNGQPGGPQQTYQQPGPGYQPQHDPRFTGGGNPGQGGMPNGQPGGGMQHQHNPGNNGGMPNHQQHAPAHDFVHNAGNQQQNGGYQQNGQHQMPGMPPNR